MIEKLLKPFLSETGKLVLEAMEKWDALREGDLSIYGPSARLSETKLIRM